MRILPPEKITDRSEARPEKSFCVSRRLRKLGFPDVRQLGLRGFGSVSYKQTHENQRFSARFRKGKMKKKGARDEGIKGLRLGQEIQERRSARSRTMDAKRTAAVTFGRDLGTKDYSKWRRNPGKYDIEGIDTASKSKTKVEARSRNPSSSALCPFCGSASWGRVQVSFTDNGVIRDAWCRTCGERSRFQEDQVFDWVSDHGDWAIGPIPSRLAYKDDRIAQLGVYRSVNGRRDPLVYVVWEGKDGSGNLSDMLPVPDSRMRCSRRLGNSSTRSTGTCCMGGVW